MRKFFHFALSFSILLFTFSIFAPSAHASLYIGSTPPLNPGANSLTSGLVGWWTFNNKDINWATGKAYDRSGFGNDGSLIGMSTSTSPVQGKMGQGLKFTSNGTGINAGDIDTADNTNTLSISFWVKAKTANTAQMHIIGKTTGISGNNGWELNRGSSENYTFYVRSDVSTTASVQSTAIYRNTAWHHVVGVYDGSNINVYVDNVGATPVAFTAILPDIAKPVCMGRVSGTPNDCFGSTSNGWEGLIDDVRIYNRALSASEIKQLYLQGQSTLEATVPAGRTGSLNTASSTATGGNGGLVGYWSFNNQDMNWKTGKAYDRSGFGNDGSLIGMSTSTSPVQGKMGQGLKFDGLGRVKIANNIGDNTGTLSVSFWAKTAITGNPGNPVTKTRDASLNTGSWLFQRNSSGQWSFTITNAAGTGTIGATKILQDKNIWHHFVGTYDGTTVQIYIDTVAGTSAASTTAGFIHRATSYPVCVGGANSDSTGGCNTQLFKGTIDDVRIYNRVLSASEIKQLYLQGQNTLEATVPAGRAGSLNTASSTATGGNGGLVGYWSFNNQDMNWKTGKAYDRSGFGNDGSLIGMSTSTSPVQGKMGQALKFNGSNSYVSGLTYNGVKTVSLWMKPNTTTQTILSLDATLASTSVSSGTISANNFTSPTIYVDGVVSSAIPNTNWHFVAITTATAINASAITIGKTGSGYYNGLLDEVRIYSRTLSATEVKQLYLQGR